MKRYCPENDAELHDLLIVGGGIYGASLAYTAALNGLRPLLVEQDDFCQHTSANSQKVIHGGLRYLQSADIKRVVESIHEKQRFFHLFPHQVKPLPCLLPTSGYTMKGNEAFRVAFLLYGLIQKLVCRGKLKKHLDKRPRILSKKEVESRFKHMAHENIRGGGLWYDGICNDPERIIISLLESSAQLGGSIANQMQVVDINRVEDNILDVTLYDKLSKKNHRVCTRKIALCTGSWFAESFSLAKTPGELRKLSLIRGLNVVVPSLFASPTSFATKTSQGDSSRFLFIVPWKNFSIEGTHWEDCTDPTATWQEHQSTSNAFHDLTQSAISGETDQVKVMSTHMGFVPGTREGKPEAADRILSHYKLIDREQGSPGDVVQVVGVKFTTAFDVVKKALQQLYPKRTIKDVLTFNHLPYGSPASPPSVQFSQYRQKYKQILSYDQCTTLFAIFGTGLPQVITKSLSPLHSGDSTISDQDFYKGLAHYCVLNEMTYHLSDLIFRRIFPNTPAPISLEVLNSLAEEMANLLHWTTEQKGDEVAQVINKQETCL